MLSNALLLILIVFSPAAADTGVCQRLTDILFDKSLDDAQFLEKFNAIFKETYGVETKITGDKTSVMREFLSSKDMTNVLTLPMTEHDDIQKNFRTILDGYFNNGDDNWMLNNLEKVKADVEEMMLSYIRSNIRLKIEYTFIPRVFVDEVRYSHHFDKLSKAEKKKLEEDLLKKIEKTVADDQAFKNRVKQILDLQHYCLFKGQIYELAGKKFEEIFATMGDDTTETDANALILFWNPLIAVTTQNLASKIKLGDIFRAHVASIIKQTYDNQP